MGLFRSVSAACLVLFCAASVVGAASPFVPPAAPSASFEAGTLHVDRYGSGAKAVVLLPGLACGAWEWFGTIEKFKGEYAIYVVTLPGFDGRAGTEKRPLFGTFAEDFWGMLEAHKIEKPVVVGHSLGGTLAIMLGEEHSERLSGIVAVDGLPVFPSVAWVTPEQRKAAAAQMAESVGKLAGADEVTSEKEYMGTIGTNKPELVAESGALEARSDSKMVAAWMGEDLTSDLRPGLGKIGVPFLEVMPYSAPDNKSAGGYTLEQTLAFYRLILTGAPHVEVVAVESSRHFVMLDQPEKFYEVVGRFLSAVK